MRVLILGGDGYLGWPTAMYLSRRGHAVALLDNFVKRRWEAETGGRPLIDVPKLPDRVRAWSRVSGRDIAHYDVDLCDYASVVRVLADTAPDVIVHYAEQPSAPFSMIDVHHAAATQSNNVIGTLNLLWALRDHRPSTHLVKLGTMGQYGTPNIDIEEGFLEIRHNNRTDRLPFPCQPGSFYHLSKVHDSHNVRFACAAWGLAATDLNQGVVYGIETDETKLDPALSTSFHYDAVFGTVLNRFCVQAILGTPLTVYGRGGQKRGFINIRDTLRCVELALLNPAPAGEYRVFNQFTEVFGVAELAETVVHSATRLDIRSRIDHLPNPRVEREDHYYNPVGSGLTALGLEPHLLSQELVGSMLRNIGAHTDSIDRAAILPVTNWRRELPATPLLARG